MPTLSDLPISLALYESVMRGNGNIADMTSILAPTWRRSIRRIGKFWLGTSTWTGDKIDLEEMFLEGMMREIRETVGGIVTWQGFAAAMRLTLDGSVYERNWLDIYNRTKTIYSRIGDNQFTNGSAEGGAWSAYNTPDTLEQSTTWVSDGSYSCHIVTTSVGGDDGAIIQTGIAIVAKKVYECRVTVNIVSGTWRLELYRTDTNENLGYAMDDAVGQMVMRASISENNEYVGTIGVRLFCEEAPGEIYADGAVFQEGPRRAETAWVENTSSQTDYGIVETALLEAGMSDASANALALSTLYEQSFPVTAPPDTMDNISLDANDAPTLEITWFGYSWTLRNRYSSVVGTDTASNHLAAIMAACQFVQRSMIDANAMSYQIEDRAPLRIWEVVREITAAGDTSGNLWQCGVGSEREFEYQRFDTAASMRYHQGRVLKLTGDALEPWFAVPGLMILDSMPLGPKQISGYERHDPRVVSIDEVEFDIAAWLKSGNGLRFRRKAAR